MRLRSLVLPLLVLALLAGVTPAVARHFVLKGPPGWTGAEANGTVTLTAPRQPARILILAEASLPPSSSLKEYLNRLIERRLNGATVRQENEATGSGAEEYGKFVMLARGGRVSCEQYHAVRDGATVAVFVFQADDVQTFASLQGQYLGFLKGVAVAPAPTVASQPEAGPGVSKPGAGVPKPGKPPQKPVARPPQQAPTGTRYALLVGVARYGNGITPLSCTLSDVEALRKTLLDPKAGRFPAANVRTLVDTSPADQQPNRVAVEKSMRWLAAMCRPEDTVLIYFSGHGYNDANGSYLLTQETDPEALLSTSLNVSDFNEMVAAIPAKKKVVILDACHSGGLLVAARDNTPMNERLRQDMLAQNAQTTGEVRFLACRDNEQSFEDTKLKQGVFSYYLVVGLRGAADTDRDGLVTFGELQGYVQAEVHRWAAQRGKNQTPTCEDKTSGVLILSDVRK